MAHGPAQLELEEIEGRLLQRLRAIGRPADDISSIAVAHAPLGSDIVELLLEFLDQATEDISIEAIGRQLAAAGIPFDGGPLVRAYGRAKWFTTKWAICNTIVAAPCRGVEEWIVRELENPDSGRAPEMLALAVPKYFDADVARALLRSAFERFPAHAARALGQVGEGPERELLASRLPALQGLAKREAARALRRIEKRLS